MSGLAVTLELARHRRLDRREHLFGTEAFRTGGWE